MKLLLFDIDGTLVVTDRAGFDAMTDAFEEVFSIKNAFSDISMMGKTDSSILQLAFIKHNVQADTKKLQKFSLCYQKHLEEKLQEPHRCARIMPGIEELLEKLHSMKEFVLGLLTGNTKTGARLKLEKFSLWHYFRIGAYGDDHSDRNQLVPIAQKRAREELQQSFSCEEIYVIGDTPRDIKCAKAGKAYSIAVATGGHCLEDLQKYKPDHCLSDLSNTNQILKIFQEKINLTA